MTFVGPCFLGSAYTHQPEFYRQCLQAFGDLPGWHVVLQIGKHTVPDELGAIAANVEVHSWVPQRAIGAEQFMNADRLVELGVARRIDTAEATARNLRSALNDLIGDPEIARRSAQLRTRAQAEGGTIRAADLIENMLV